MLTYREKLVILRRVVYWTALIINQLLFGMLEAQEEQAYVIFVIKKDFVNEVVRTVRGNGRRKLVVQRVSEKFSFL